MVTSTVASTLSPGYPASVHHDRADMDPMIRLSDHSPPQPAPAHFPDVNSSMALANRPKPSPRFSRQFGDDISSSVSMAAVLL